MSNSFQFPQDSANKPGVVKVIKNGQEFIVPVDSRLKVKDYIYSASNLNKTYTSDMNEILIYNDGFQDITVNILSFSIIIKPQTCLDERFEDFRNVVVTANGQNYRLLVRGY